MNKWIKKLTAALCAAVLMCGMAVTAYAGGGEEWDGLAPVAPLPTNGTGLILWSRRPWKPLTPARASPRTATL